MATFIEVYSQHGPRIVAGQRAGSKQLTRRMADTTGQHRGEILRVLLALLDALVYFNREGRTVEIPGIGSFQPVLKGDGRIRVQFHPTADYIHEIENLKDFEGEIRNSENIGLSPEGFKEIWDAAHPDDPMELPRLAA